MFCKSEFFFATNTKNRSSSAEVGDTKSFELLPTQRLCSYKVRLEDIGHCLRCECIVIDSFGRSTEPTYAETSSVLPGHRLSNALKCVNFVISIQF